MVVLLTVSLEVAWIAVVEATFLVKPRRFSVKYISDREYIHGWWEFLKTKHCFRISDIQAWRAWVKINRIHVFFDERDSSHLKWNNALILPALNRASWCCYWFSPTIPFQFFQTVMIVVSTTALLCGAGLVVFPRLNFTKICLNSNFMVIS